MGSYIEIHARREYSILDHIGVLGICKCNDLYFCLRRLEL
jgi:hypothetical protein